MPLLTTPPDTSEWAVAQLLCAASYAGAEAVACGLANALRPLVRRSLVYVVREERAGAAACDRLVAQVRAASHEPRVFSTSRRVDPGLRRALVGALSADDVAVAHCHAYKPAVALGRAGVPLVYTAHGFDQSTLRGRVTVRAFTEAARLATDATIAVSRSTAEALEWLPHDPRTVTVIPNGLSGEPPPATAVAARRESARAELAARHGLDPAAPWTVALGRLVPVKAFDALLDAAALALSGRSGCLLLAGDGPEAERLAARAERADLAGRVVLLGRVADVSALYAAADLVVLSSRSEASPMVVIEAMAHGRPVVATSVGGVPDLVRDGVTGRLVAPGDVRALATAWGAALDAPESRARWGEAARRYAVAELGARRWAERHLAVYAAARATGRGGARAAGVAR